ncbi:MAG TPA: hypothetical protein VFY61_08375 [Pyrinomonadaceae bacterium]|nr:hypothetical protein [Pyrinomonadaceae bacterium]
MNAIPQPVEELVDVLAEMPGAVAVVLGGSRAVRSEEAVMQEAHAIVCERSVCNEKRLIETAGLGHIHSLFSEIPAERERLLEWDRSRGKPD